MTSGRGDDPASGGRGGFEQLVSRFSARAFFQGPFHCFGVSSSRDPVESGSSWKEKVNRVFIRVRLGSRSVESCFLVVSRLCLICMQRPIPLGQMFSMCTITSDWSPARRCYPAVIIDATIAVTGIPVAGASVFWTNLPVNVWPFYLSTAALRNKEVDMGWVLLLTTQQVFSGHPQNPYSIRKSTESENY